MTIDVANKVVVITGSSRGIGRELARIFAKEKAKVVINYFKSQKQAEELFSEISNYNTECFLIKADVSNADDVCKICNETVKRFGRVDALINNAGCCNDGLLNIMPLEKWQSTIDVNLTGAFLCSREFSKIMIEQGCGKIINIASLKGQQGSANQVNYSTSKAGLIGFTKSLAKELGCYNISVNALCPGFIITDLNINNPKKIDVSNKESALPTSSLLNDLFRFTIYMVSDNIRGVSGRVFNLDSRIL